MLRRLRVPVEPDERPAVAAATRPSACRAAPPWLFVDTVFNCPTLAECYKTAAFDGINRLGLS